MYNFSDRVRDRKEKSIIGVIQGETAQAVAKPQFT